jgi:hypothetical protein
MKLSECFYNKSDGLFELISACNLINPFISICFDQSFVFVVVQSSDETSTPLLA